MLTVPFRSRLLFAMLLAILASACSGTSFTAQSGKEGGDKDKNKQNNINRVTDKDPNGGDDDDDDDDDDDNVDDDTSGSPRQIVVVCQQQGTAECDEKVRQAQTNADEDSEIVIVDCTVEPSNPGCSQISASDDEQTIVRKFSIKQGTWLDGQWDLKLDYENGEALLTLGGSFAGGRMIITVQKGSTTEEITLVNGSNVKLPNWRKACDAAPVGWDQWRQAFGDPDDRERPPTLRMNHQKPVIHWTGDDDLNGASGAVAFDNLNFGLKYRCN